MVDTLIIYILNVYPGVVSLFRSFGPVTESLMLGKGLSNFTEVDIDLLLNQLSSPNLHVQYVPETWQEFDPESVSVRAISQYIHALKENF